MIILLCIITIVFILLAFGAMEEIIDNYCEENMLMDWKDRRDD